MYDSKQSGQSWNEYLDKTLRKLNFKRSQADACVYYKRNKANLLIIAVYVDDLLILANNEESLSLLKRQLSQNERPRRSKSYIRSKNHTK